jgi:cell division protein FtsX
MTMSEVDKIRLTAEAAIERSRERRRPIGTKSVALRRQHLYRKLGRILIAGGAVLIGAALSGPVGRIAAAYGSRFELAGLDAAATLALFGGGALLGWLGAWISATRHLRAIEPGVEPG